MARADFRSWGFPAENANEFAVRMRDRLAMRRMRCYALVERDREVDKFGGDARTAVK
jgi:hypothetical protein